eukprot:10589118-Prorocentrum_lima.AAC.1
MATIRSMQKKLGYWKTKEWAAKEERGRKVAAMWQLRVGLGPPGMPFCVVAMCRRDFGSVEKKSGKPRLCGAR